MGEELENTAFMTARNSVIAFAFVGRYSITLWPRPKALPNALRCPREGPSIVSPGYSATSALVSSLSRPVGLARFSNTRTRKLCSDCASVITWTTELAPQIDVCPVQLPGREERFNEPAHTDLRALASMVITQLQAYFDKPYALFGHSMGALLSYEVSRQLEAQGAPMPVRTFLSAYVPPHRPSRWSPIHHLPDDAFLDEIRQLDGTP